MTEFLHTLAQELRSREQYLEDHNDHPVFDNDTGERLRRDFEALVARVKDFARVVEEAHMRGDDIDLHFKEKIADESQKIKVEISTWRKTLSPDS